MTKRTSTAQNTIYVEWSMKILTNCPLIRNFVFQIVRWPSRKWDAEYSSADGQPPTKVVGKITKPSHILETRGRFRVFRLPPPSSIAVVPGSVENGGPVANVVHYQEVLRAAAPLVWTKLLPSHLIKKGHLSGTINFSYCFPRKANIRPNFK